MSDHDPWESAMSRDFDTRVRDLHEAPLGLADVQDRARSLRRRRRATVAGAALATVAIVLPTALLAGLPGTEDRSGPGPAEAPTTPGETASVEPTYLAEGIWHRADGSEVPLPEEDYYDAVVWEDQLVALRSLDDQGRTSADIIDAQGSVTDSFETEGGVAVNEAGTTLAWLDTDRRIMTRWEGGEAAISDPGVPGRVVAVTGGPDCHEAADGCRVFTDTKAYDSHGMADTRVPGQVKVNDARDDQITATDEVSDDGSCGGVYDDAARRFRVHGCEHTYDEIAPGGGYVVGLPSYLDGIGPGRAAILDADDGTELARYDDTMVMRTAWVDESRLLITAYDYDESRWHLLTLAADGTVTEVVDPVAGEDLASPFVPVEGG